MVTAVKGYQERSRTVRMGIGQGWSWMARGGQGGKGWSRSKVIKSGQGCQRCSKMNTDGMWLRVVNDVRG